MKRLRIILLVYLVLIAVGCSHTRPLYSDYEELADQLVVDTVTGDFYAAMFGHLPEELLKEIEKTDDLQAIISNEFGMSQEEYQLELDKKYGLNWTYSYAFNNFRESDIENYNFFETETLKIEKVLEADAEVCIKSAAGDTIDQYTIPLNLLRYPAGWGGNIY